MMRVTEHVRDRIRQRDELIPPGFSWSFGIMIDATTVLILIGSTLQRSSADLPAAGVAALVGVSPMLLLFLSGVKYSPGLVWGTSWTATVILLFATSTPVASDFAPLLLVMMVGCVAALAGVMWAALSFGSAVALLVAASTAHRLDGLALYLSFVAIGWLSGYLMRIQAELLVKQQEMQADLAAHAAADERRRIAREVHDVIAHSLSVTMLHVTGARHALQRDRDVDDAVTALVDAERLGRQAMADIRRTVGLLDTGPTKMVPEPGIADIRDLVDDFVQAGLQVSLQTEGPTEQVSAAVGLALYRITQESLANIAKHAPDSNASVRLVISPSTAVLAVVNELPVAVPAGSPSADGRGLAGMRQRVELLGGILDAGPCSDGWSVRAEIPLTDDPRPRPRRCAR
ncbi:sensor histidine kinase [uncultured Mycobacterium sp.]|uniref:sensor histidine kinase n=1 Tax=uncultured Mycobacterium sp. TaxID=171292 RepID=UPI0035CC0A4D